MRHRNRLNKLSLKSSHRKAMIRNMLTSLFRHESITTTKAKAKVVQRAAEKMITRSKVDSVHNRREIAKSIYDKDVTNKLFTVIGPMFAERNGGYTRVLKLGFRQGDAAEMAILELVEKSADEKAEKSEKKSEAKTAKKPAAKKAAPKKAAAKKAEPKKEEAPAEEKAEEAAVEAPAEAAAEEAAPAEKADSDSEKAAE